MEDRSVKRDKTEGELVVSHLVRHLVSAQPVIIVSAEAGVSLINQDISVCLSFIQLSSDLLHLANTNQV